MKVLVTQSCPTLCNPMDCILPGSSAHGVLQAMDTGVDSVQRLLDPKNLMWVRRQQYYRLLLISLGGQCDASQNIFAVVVSSLKQQNDFGATLWASLRHTSP